MQQLGGQFRNNISSPLSLPVFQQETQPQPIVPPDFVSMPMPLTEAKPLPLIRLSRLSKQWFTRIVAGALTLLLAGAIFVIWFAAPTASPSSLSGKHHTAIIRLFQPELRRLYSHRWRAACVRHRFG